MWPSGDPDPDPAFRSSGSLGANLLNVSINASRETTMRSASSEGFGDRRIFQVSECFFVKQTTKEHQTSGRQAAGERPT